MYTISAPDNPQRPFWPNKELDTDELAQQHTDHCFEMQKTVPWIQNKNAAAHREAQCVIS